MKVAVSRLSIAVSILALAFPLFAQSPPSTEKASKEELITPYEYVVHEIADANKVLCRVEIETGLLYATHHIERVFDASNNDGQRVRFQIPGKDYTCWLLWFSTDEGTSLSCQFDYKGMAFAQSDRTVLREYPALNNLRFRVNDTIVHIKTKCARQDEEVHSVE